MAKKSNITMEIKGLKELEAAFAMSPEIVKEALDPAIRTVIALLDKKARMETPVDTGHLRRSHTEEFSTLQGRLSNVIEYANPVHSKIPFYDIAVDQTEPQADKIFEKALENITTNLAK